MNIMNNISKLPIDETLLHYAIVEAVYNWLENNPQLVFDAIATGIERRSEP
jgi:hypothetical protein